MLKTVFSAFMLCLAAATLGQVSGSGKISVGIEQDVLPYVTGGYFAGIWAGKEHLRVRALTAKVNKPDFIIKEGFANNKVTAYVLVADYFLNDNWKGFWVGTGPVYWRSSIQTSRKISTAFYNTWLLNGSAGYNFSLTKNIYLSPWCGMHLRLAGDKKVMVDDKIFKSSFINPEASFKVGVLF